MQNAISENCVRMGELLRLGRPVSESVFLGALQDPDYAHNLMACRDAPPLLDFLLKNPPQTDGPDPQSGHSTLDLVSKASKSFWEWARSGFGLVDDATYTKRFETCLACPNLASPPSTAIYKMIGAVDDRKKICKLCGCVVSRKAKLPHEACPDADPELPGMNRWGEPMRPAARTQSGDAGKAA